MPSMPEKPLGWAIAAALKSGRRPAASAVRDRTAASAAAS